MKSEVRKLAEELGLAVATKNDSQEICFVPNGDYAAFIDSYFREQGIDPAESRGEIVDTSGRVLRRAFWHSPFHGGPAARASHCGGRSRSMSSRPSLRRSASPSATAKS